MDMGQFEEEVAAEMKCYELTSASIPHHSAPLRAEEVEESGGKLSPGRSEVEVLLFICLEFFSSHYPILLFIDNKVNPFPQAESFLPS